MSRPWSAEHVVSEPLARSMIENQFPDLAPVRVEPLAIGWDNTAVIVNGAFVFRFPRRQVAVELLEVEYRLLPEIAPRLPLPVPVPTMAGRPEGGFPWPFAGYRLLCGTSADAFAPSAEQRKDAAEPIARFLAALHGIDGDQAARLGAHGDRLGRCDLVKRVPLARENLDRIVGAGLVEDGTPWLRILDEMDLTQTAGATALVHGDLYARHILMNPDGHVCGVIDWGDLHIGDPAVDLSIAHGFLPPNAHATFRRVYGSIDDDTWRLAKFRALYHATVTTTYGREIGDDVLLREGLTVLRHLAMSG